MREPYSYRRDPAVPAFADDRPIIVFDGHCALCSGWAGTVLKHDRRGVFRLLAAQSPLGRALYSHYGLDPENYETNLLIEDGVLRIKADGSIRMAERLGLPFSLARAFRILPRPIADALYELVARNRLRWFGRCEACYLPPAEFKERFL